MFDDNSVTWDLAIILRTMDIALSLDHMTKLDEEGYDLSTLDEVVVEALVAQQEDLTSEINARTGRYYEVEYALEAEDAAIRDLMADCDHYADRMLELTS